MKALTLHNPWAHLVSIGAKTFETRSWRTNYRGLLAIHSSRSMAHWDDTLVDVGAHNPTFKWPWNRYCEPSWDWMYGQLAYGSVVAIVCLKNCYPAKWVKNGLHRLISTGGSKSEYAAKELAFGDFSPGRWAWELEPICAIDVGLLVRGYQGLWTLPTDHEQLLLTTCAANGLYPTPFRILPSPVGTTSTSSPSPRPSSVL